MRTWRWPAGLALLALAGVTGAPAAERGATSRKGAPEAVDAEMLRDLDLLESPNYARDREVARRIGFFERLRLLESQPGPEPTAGPAVAPGSAPVKGPR